MIAVAIDGPAGAGKSTIARAVADELGFIYVDTGALYRTIGLSCVENNIDISDTDAVVSVLPQTDIRIVFLNGEQRVLLNDKDVSEKIRTEQISMAASTVSAIPKVREFLLDLQRGFAKTDNVIMDGRDIGTVVLPNAQVKIFLTASPEKRAERRMKQLAEKNIDAEYDDILSDIIKRDYNDSHRKTAPLKPAENSVIIDTTTLTLEQSIKKIADTVKEKIL
ncbi:MAG: (d)CMP kinase [Acutalibacteraceae bacterium]